MPSGLTGPQHRCSRSWRGACRRSRWCWCSPSESRASFTSWPLDDRVRDRILAEAHGNPLALIELPHELPPVKLAGGFALPDGLPLPGRIEASFRRRVQQLPAATQRLLLVAAAEPTGEP